MDNTDITTNFPNIDHTAAGLSNLNGLDSNLKAETFEVELLQTLAHELAECAHKPKELKKKNLWTKHNDLEKTQPLVFCDPENGWNEIIDQNELICRNPLLREWEMYFRKEIFWSKSIKDDKVAEAVLNIPYSYTDTGYGMNEDAKNHGGKGGSFKYLLKLEDYERDFLKLSFPEITVDYNKTKEVIEFAESLFDNILEIKLKGNWWWTLGLTWDFIKIRGLENLMMDMLMQPDWVHKLMKFLSDATLYKLNFLEEQGLLSLNTGGSYVGSGGFGWTNQLPAGEFSPEQVLLKDMWGFCESQETVGVGPDQFGEFVSPYQLPILEKFGINCYGCCEPLEARWEYISKVPNLRRVSVSPWSNVNTMAEILEDKYIFSRKPSPVDLATPKPNWDKIRMEMRKFLQDTRNCNVEIIMKDNHTLGKNPENVINWCKITKEEIARIY